jgi:aryl sulfotransferase
VRLKSGRFAWLVSYPRSGNTWLRFMIASLMQGGRPVDINAPTIRAQVASRDEFDEIFCVDSTLLTDEEATRARPSIYRFISRCLDGPPILRKVHDRCWRNSAGERMFPPELSHGAVYIARDPRDVAISCAHFMDCGVDEMIRRMGDPGTTIANRPSLPQFPQPLGGWSDHVRSWLDDGGMPVHPVRYEDLLAEPAEQLAKVADFLGISHDAASEAVDSVRFEALREQEDKRGFRESTANQTRFFRQGKAGVWRSVLSAAQVKRLEKDHGEVMARLGYL